MELSDIKRLKALEEENRQLKQMFADLGLKHKALEDILEKNVWSTLVLQAQYVKPFAQKQKNDHNDAVAIMEAANRPTIRSIRIKIIEQQDLQAMHRIRDRLVNHRTRLICQARGLLLEYGISLRGEPGNFKKQTPEVLEDANNDLSQAARTMANDLLEELYFLEDRILSITKRIEAWAASDDTSRRLMSIPGVGALSATALVAAVGDDRQFRKGRDLAAWMGLVPRQFSTGGVQSLSGITKPGNSYLRRLFCHGARTCSLHLNRSEHALGTWIDQLCSRMYVNKVTIALANKMVRIAWVIMTKPGATYRRIDPAFN